LGMIIAPIVSAADSGTLTPPEVAVLRAKVTRDLQSFRQLAESFCSVGDLFLREEVRWIMTEAEKLASYTGALVYPESRAELAINLPRQIAAVRERINHVPVELPQGILDLTPFQIYLQLRATISAAQHRVELYDPYIDASVFVRYFAELDEKVHIRVVTTTRRLSGGWSELDRQRLLDVVALFGGERGTSFSLLLVDELHDRHLRVDNVVMHLGGSIKDAGKKAPFSLSRMTATADETLDALLAGARAWAHNS
jgi:hypothetical protein